MNVDEAMEAINTAQLLLRDFDAGLRRVRAQEWNGSDPHEMNVAGALVRDYAWAKSNASLNEVYALLHTHLARKVDDSMVDRAISTYWHTLYELGTGFSSDGEPKAMKAALVAALGVEGA